MIQFSEEELDSIEAKIFSEFQKFEEQKYILPSLFLASVSEAFKAIRSKKSEPGCVNCISWQPYLREGTCRVLIKDANTNKLINQTTKEDFYCKHHQRTYEEE